MEVQIQTPSLIFSFDLKLGSWDIKSRITPRTVIRKACPLIRTTTGDITFSSRKWNVQSWPYSDNLGEGLRYRFSVDNNAVSLQFYINQYHHHQFLTMELVVTNRTTQSIDLKAISPLNILASKEGGIFIGTSPSKALVFENGLSFVQEFLLRSFNASEEADSPWMIYIYSKPPINENILIGVIDKPGDVCRIVTQDEETKGFIFENREGIAEFRAEKMFSFPKTLAAEDCLSSGVWIIDIDLPTGFDALEKYALIVRDYNNIRLWPYAIPVGWNSWNNPINGYPQDSYSHHIDEKIILDNLAIATKEFKPFSLAYWNIDEGWMKEESCTVDEPDLEHFPHGLKYIADKIHAAGLKAGIWINPFNVGKKSKLFQEHMIDGWFPDPDKSFPIKSKWRSLDLTIPAVQEYLRHYIRKVVKEWGFDLLKCDFTYFVIAPRKFANPNMNGTEVLRLGYKIIREEAGPNTFIFGIGGPIGLHWGDVDAERIGLDTLPRWGSEHYLGVTESGVEPSYRCFARRYYMNRRIWINHLDCLCFRGSLPRYETLILATAIALLGGLWKIGDKVIQMKSEDIAVEQKLIPVYAEGRVRPLDLFRTLIPEILDLYIPKPSISWHIVAVFHWGENQDLITGNPMSQDIKDITVNFEEIGFEKSKKVLIYSFWDEKFLGSFIEKLVIKVHPHHHHLLVVHENQGHPQYLSSNRHLTQGGIEIGDVQWSEKDNLLSGSIHVVGEFHHQLTFYIPSNFLFKSIDFQNGIVPQTSIENEILIVKFKCSLNLHDSMIAWRIQFAHQ